MKIQAIITETLNRYLQENVFPEKKEHKKKKHEDNESKDEDDDFISEQDAQYIISRFKKNEHLINIAALARDIYPNHTDEGAQSQLRKKIEQETNDNGVPYKFTKREARIITRVLDSFKM
jgi:hypothetical protein